MKTYSIKAHRTAADVAKNNVEHLGGGYALEDAARVSLLHQKTGWFVSVWIEEERSPSRASSARSSKIAQAFDTASQGWTAGISERSSPMSTVYLIHFNRRLKHAGHYMGFSTNLDKRITDHLCGMGARLMEVVTQAGIEWKVARTWPGASRGFERRLKNGKNAPQLCPLCSGKAAYGRGAK